MERGPLTLEARLISECGLEPVANFDLLLSRFLYPDHVEGGLGQLRIAQCEAVSIQSENPRELVVRPGDGRDIHCEAFLGIANPSLSEIRFFEADGTVAMALVILLPDAWNFRTSFTLPEEIPGDWVDLPEKGKSLIFSTTWHLNYPLGDGSKEGLMGCDVRPGLNFVSSASLGGSSPVGALMEVLDPGFAASVPLQFEGFIIPALRQTETQEPPLYELSAELPRARFDLAGYLKVSRPRIGLQRMTASTSRVFLAVDLQLGKAKSRMFASLAQGTRMLQISIGARDAESPITLPDLLSVGDGEDSIRSRWKSVSDCGFLHNAASSFGLISFGADVLLDSRPRLFSTDLSAGIGRPVPIFDWLSLEKFNVAWACLRPLDSPVHQISIAGKCRIGDSLVVDLKGGATLGAQKTFFLEGGASGSLSLGQLAGSGDLKLDLEQVALRVDWRGPGKLDVIFEGAAQIKTTGWTPEANLKVAYHGADGGFEVHAEIKEAGTVDAVAKGVAELAGHASAFSPPAVVGQLSLDDLRFDYHTATRNLSAELAISDKALGNASLDLKLDVVSDPGTKDRKITVGGSLKFEIETAKDPAKQAELKFDVEFAKDGGNWLAASYENQGQAALSLASLLGSMGVDMPTFLGGTDLSLKSAFLARHADPANPGSINPGDKGNPAPGAGTLFACEIDGGVDLSALEGLPIIGKLLKRFETLSLALTPVLSSRAFAAGELDPIAGDIPRSLDLAGEIPKGASLQIRLDAGDLHKTLSFCRSVQSDAESGGDPIQAGPPQTKTFDAQAAAESPDPGESLAATPAGTPQPKVKWIGLNKHFGPLSIDKIGVGYQAKQITVLLDGGLKIGPFTGSLEGLGASYDIPKHELSFHLKGVGIGYDKPPLQIGGAFLMLEHGFAGELRVKFEQLGLGAIGAYEKFGSDPSLFIYIWVDFPLGGPPWFFIEGLAAGIGINRRLTVPGIDQIHTFPLVSNVIGGSPAGGAGLGNQLAAADGNTEPSKPGGTSNLANQLAVLEKYLAPEVGQFWAAAGLKFNSFELIDVFALLAIQIGHRFELDLIGVGTVQVPPATPEAVVYIQAEAYAKLVIDSEEAYFIARAKLVRGSYVYEPLIHLQGGIALAAWMKGPHAGQFVFSAGGYHPEFDISKYPFLPQHIDRIGFDWQVIPDTLEMRGGLYFAILPHLMMAGGYFSATFHSGSVHAWFDFGADLLISFKPFYYKGDAYIDIGLRFGSKTGGFNLHASANLRFWGPKFGAHLKVSVKILFINVKVTVDVGSKHLPPPPISLEEFWKSFIAGNDVVNVAVSRGGIRKIQANRVAGVDFDRGQTSAKLQASPPLPNRDDYVISDWMLVNPKELALKIQSKIPISPTGIQPCAYSKDQFSSSISHKVTRGENTPDESLVFLPSVERVPRALWNPDASRDGVIGLNDPDTVDAVTGYTVHPAKPARPGASKTVEAQDLQFTMAGSVPGPAAAGLTSGFYPQGAATDLESSGLGVPAFAEALGFDPARDIRLSDSLCDAFIVPPVSLRSAA